MVDAKQNKGSFDEEDVYTLLQKYSPQQVLALLREVAQSPDVKIGWNALVKKTATGIDNAREYQMLWRHLAYRQPLVEKVEAGAQPLDDDSDLEYELEASPPVSTEVAMEVVTCVKVLALGLPNECSLPNRSIIEGDMPNGHSSQISSEHPHSSLLHSSNTTRPVSVQKQLQPAGISGEGLDTNGAPKNNYPSRRKRKQWSEEEDLQLIDAVKRRREGNWAAIAKGEFNGNMTASQLSQRWSTLKKKQGSLNVGVNGSQLSEEHLATRHALEHALNNNLTAGCGTVGNGAASTSNSTNLNASNKDSPVSNITVPSKHQLAQVVNTTSVKPTPIGSSSTPHPLPKKAPAIPGVTADPIQAAAVAAGARIASPSDAKSLFMAAQAKKTLHNFRGGSLIKSSAAASASCLPPNVHFIRTGLSAAPPTMTAANQAKANTVKPSVPTASVSQLSRAKTIPIVALERSNATRSSSTNELQQMEDRISAEVKVSGSDTKSIAEVLENTTLPPRCLPKAPPEQQIADGDNSQCTRNKDLTENEPKDEALVVDGVIEKMEVSGEALAAAEKSDPMEL